MSKYPVVAIAGGSGWLGEKVVRGFLEEKKHTVKVLARDNAKNKVKLDELATLGAVIVHIDIESDSVDKIQHALQGADAVISTLSGGAAGTQINLIEAAKAAGVKRFIPSEFGIEYNQFDTNDIVLSIIKNPTMEALKKSGLEWTRIVNGMYYETQFSPLFKFDVHSGKVNIPGDGNSKFDAIHSSDVGRLLPYILENPVSKNATIFIRSEIVTYNQVIDVFDKHLGKKLERVYHPADEIRAQVHGNPDKFKTIIEQLLWTTTTNKLVAEHNHVGDLHQPFTLINIEDFVTQSLATK